MEKPALDRVYKGPFNKKSTAEEVTEGLDLTGKTVLITGMNSGIGFETAKVMAMRGAHVLGTARSLEKAQQACDAIAGKTTPFVCELSNPQSIVDCAKAVNAQGIPLDIVMCNAGVMNLPELEQIMGVEKQMFVNTFGHYLLINNLVESLKKAPEPRVVITGSSAHKLSRKLDLDDLGANKKYAPNRNYNISKLTNILLCTELSRRLSEENIAVNSVHPGMIMTNLERHMTSLKDKLMMSVMEPLFFVSIPQGAATQTFVATAPGLKGVSGHYFEVCQPKAARKDARDEKLAADFLKICDDILKDYLIVT